MKEKVIKDNYQGHLLVSHPGNPDDNLKNGVILLISYSDNLSIGLQLNKPIEHVKLEQICQNMDIMYQGDECLYYGGIVGTGKVHVVHSNDWRGHSTMVINEQISITSDISVLVALADDEGPSFFRACAGYWTWNKNILDSQIGISDAILTDYKWELLPADLDHVFNYDGDEQWERCIHSSAELQVKYWF